MFTLFQAFPRFVDSNALLSAIRGLRVKIEFYKKLECPEVQIKRMFAAPVIRQLAQRTKFIDHRMMQHKVLVIKVSLSPYNCSTSRCTVHGEIVQNRTPVRPLFCWKQHALCLSTIACVLRSLTCVQTLHVLMHANIAILEYLAQSL